MQIKAGHTTSALSWLGFASGLMNYLTQVGAQFPSSKYEWGNLGLSILFWAVGYLARGIGLNPPAVTKGDNDQK